LIISDYSVLTRILSILLFGYTIITTGDEVLRKFWPSLGLEECNPHQETIFNYLEQIEVYFLMNEIDEKRQDAVFLNVISGHMYSLLSTGTG